MRRVTVAHIMSTRWRNDAHLRRNSEQVMAVAMATFRLSAAWPEVLYVVIYAAVGHPDLAPDNAEVSEGRWWTRDEILAASGKGILTPNFEQEFANIQASLLALL